MFDTKIAIVVRDDLAIWQKLNVTAFLTSTQDHDYPSTPPHGRQRRDVDASGTHAHERAVRVAAMGRSEK
jgi:hypothetical protein